jgi:primosomal protein N'
LEKLFPEAKLFRIDSDSTSNLTQKRETLEKLSASDIIIGTKMITT